MCACLSVTIIVTSVKQSNCLWLLLQLFAIWAHTAELQTTKISPLCVPAMRPRGRMTFCKAVDGKGGQLGSIIKTQGLNDSLQSLRRFEFSPNISFLPAPAPHFFQSLVPSWHCLFQYLMLFSSYLFQSLLTPSGGIMAWTPWLNTTWPPKFPVTPWSAFAPPENAVGRLVDNILEKGWEGKKRYGVKNKVNYPVLPNTCQIQFPQEQAWMWGRFGQNPKSHHLLWPLASHNLPGPSQMTPALSYCSQAQTARAALPAVWRNPVWIPSTPLPCPTRQFTTL